jgi:ATP phosphoribosyltransferase
VQTGSTLRANGLAEVETVAQVTSRVIVNRAALKTDRGPLRQLLDRLRDAAAA